MLSETRDSGSSLLFQIREELDRWVGSVRGGNGTWSPATDMYVDEGELYVEVEIPGVDPGDVEILTEGVELTVRAVSADPQPPKSSEIVERRRGTYERKFSVSLDWDLDNTHASMRDGVLTLRIPPAPGARRVEVETTATLEPAPLLHTNRHEPLMERPNGNGIPRPTPFLVPSVIGGTVDKETDQEGK